MYGSNVHDQQIYAEGYIVGFFEGSGGSPLEVFGYMVFERQPLWTLGLIIVAIMLIWVKLKSKNVIQSV